MCGITGIFHRTGRNADPRGLLAMREAVSHRGPDDAGVWIEGAVGLAHRRLSIRDLSPAGRQPQADPSGRIVVSYNGEIYNDAELRSELQRDFGFAFRSTCDTEILPLGYLAWGYGLFERLEGMFAIALWDRQERRLVLARDSVGVKPLYYFADRDVVRFGSEIKALLADPDQPRRISAEGVHKFLAMGYAGPTSSMLEGVMQTPPGSFIAFTSASSEAKRFWRPRRKPDIHTLDDAADAFAAVWPRVVDDQLISDVPVGILQSSGIDSTLVSLAANRTPERRTPLFTASFAEESFDEAPLAQMVAAKLGAPFHRVEVRSEAGLAEVLQEIVAIYDGQIADEASIPLYLLSAAVRRHVTVALTGDGGDEFFAGYPTYTASRMAQRFGRFLGRGSWAALGEAAYARGAKDESRLPTIAKFRRFALGIADGGADAAHAYWRRLVPQFLLPELYGAALRPLAESDAMEEYRALIDEGSGELIDRCLLADQQFHLPAGLLIKSDHMSMAHGLELRVPLLDRRVMDLAGRIDAKVLIDAKGVGKRVLRAAAQRLDAPTEIVGAKKRGFNAPLARILRTDLSALATRIFETEADLLQPWLNASTVRRLWREHRDGSVNHDYALWPMLNLGLWLSRLGVSRLTQAADTRLVDALSEPL